ncbi:protein of unknown function [Algoriphagus ornithinivorans]|uniref:DUF4221 domain-containing protein n=1 Tax=Algoriphagus ornithinivorans TaxID=226506 RepID=A0A1I5EZH7_9BACT|nr:DUF4221 family protein [Algoriphagus ornithinivorans]SFO16796.1 protein of unknown function [Algoriphagus ornithinivorans]
MGYFKKKNFLIDTFVVDATGEIIFLKYQLFGSDKSKDDKYLFNFNLDDHTLEKINLDQLKLEEKLRFEKEGPNGTGHTVGKIKIHSENRIMINGMNYSSLFSLKGERLLKIYFENFSLGGHPMEGGEELRFSRELDTKTNRLYGIILRHKDKSFALGILHLNEYEITKMELSTFQKLPHYTFTNILPGGSMLNKSPEIEIEKFGSKIILSNQITNALMWYDTEMDSLFLRSYSSQLTANCKLKDYQLQHESDESFDAEYNRFLQEINFLAPFWDEKNQIFYRFSYKLIPIEDNINTELKWKVFLTALDKDLNLIGEISVPQLTKVPAKHFAKDGKIWIFENINDELAFQVIEIADSL